MSTLRVAIVGAGPKGMSALERLVHHASHSTSRAMYEVDLYEPHRSPGAGPIYDPRHPAYLRMNIAADIVDAWWTPARVPDVASHPSFGTWRSLQLPSIMKEFGDAALDAFPPRAVVGRYLEHAFAKIVESAPESMRARVVPHRVLDIEPMGAGWGIRADGLGMSGKPYDEVLIATGHASEWSDALTQVSRSSPSSVTTVFPVQEQLSRERVAPGAAVAVRGFALTCIDAALALTQGRGGSFHALDHPWRLRYERGPDDILCLLPFTRSGRPMLSKPLPDLLANVDGISEITARGQERIRALAASYDLRVDLLPVLVDTAVASIQAVTSAGDNPVSLDPLRADADEWLRGALDGSLSSVDGDDVVSQIAKSLEIGCGAAAPHALWALGHAWRSLYPAIVDRVGGNGLTAVAWPAFVRLATELERIAFGPPAVNAAKLLALVDAGIVDLTHLHGGRLVGVEEFELRSAAGSTRVDAVVDAVLPPPGIVGLSTAPLATLLAAGAVRPRHGRRGLDVLDDGSCVGANGVATPGLAAIGRPTEDSTIGNDTLSRRMHPLAELWAERVVARARRERSCAARPRADLARQG
ncbi:MAG: FAD/NAD(P)-binding protein [Actinobacteria bacterium]|nr:FAD/NAD(P)-binding protein [Actinomycetota bacterium]